MKKVIQFPRIIRAEKEREGYESRQLQDEDVFFSLIFTHDSDSEERETLKWWKEKMQIIKEMIEGAFQRMKKTDDEFTPSLLQKGLLQESLQQRHQ